MGSKPKAQGQPDTGSGPPAEARTRVVAPDGDDEAAGTEVAPWRTVEHGLESVTAGDTLLLRAGRYEERITEAELHHGTPQARITVAPFPGEQPVLVGLLWLRRPTYWTVRGLRITWGGDDPEDHLVKVTDGVGWTFEANEVSGARSFAGLLVAGTRDGEPAHWRVVGNCIHDTVPSNRTNQDHLIYVNTGLGAGAGVIEGNLLYGAPNGAGVKLGGPSADEGGAVSTQVSYNTIAGTAQAVIVAWRSRDNAIHRNILGPVGEGYATIRAFELTGGRNRATENIGFAARRMILDDAGGTAIERDANRFPVDPAFGPDLTCDGYVPASTLVDGYGHTAAALPLEAQRR